jgi:hypothetical protein
MCQTCSLDAEMENIQRIFIWRPLQKWLPEKVRLRWQDKIEILRFWDCELNWRSCPIVGFGINNAEPMGSAIRVSFRQLVSYQWLVISVTKGNWQNNLLQVNCYKKTHDLVHISRMLQLCVCKAEVHVQTYSNLPTHIFKWKSIFNIFKLSWKFIVILFLLQTYSGTDTEISIAQYQTHPTKRIQHRKLQLTLIKFYFATKYYTSFGMGKLNRGPVMPKIIFFCGFSLSLKI